jgi:hypothetical protein
MPNRPSSVQLQRASCFDDYSHGHAELLRPTWLHNAHSAPLPDPAGTVKHKCTPQVTNRRVICEKDGELFRQPQLQEHFINGSISRNWNRGLPGSAARSDKAEARLKCAVFAARLDAMKVRIGLLGGTLYFRSRQHWLLDCRPPGRSAIQARPIPERLNRCRASWEAPGGEPPSGALGFEAVWVNSEYRAVSACRKRSVSPECALQRNTDAVRTIPNVTGPSAPPA